MNEKANIGAPRTAGEALAATKRMVMAKPKGAVAGSGAINRQEFAKLKAKADNYGGERKSFIGRVLDKKRGAERGMQDLGRRIVKNHREGTEAWRRGEMKYYGTINPFKK